MNTLVLSQDLNSFTDQLIKLRHIFLAMENEACALLDQGDKQKAWELYNSIAHLALRSAQEENPRLVVFIFLSISHSSIEKIKLLESESKQIANLSQLSKFNEQIQNLNLDKIYTSSAKAQAKTFFNSIQNDPQTLDQITTKPYVLLSHFNKAKNKLAKTYEKIGMSQSEQKEGDPSTPDWLPKDAAKIPFELTYNSLLGSKLLLKVKLNSLKKVAFE